MAIGLALGIAAPAIAADPKPNILIIWGDDIGQFNINAYNHGMMGYRTPNIDRIANEGALFTDWYGQLPATPHVALPCRRKRKRREPELSPPPGPRQPTASSRSSPLPSRDPG